MYDASGQAILHINSVDCPRAFDRCTAQRPDLLSAGATQAACWLHAAPPEVRA